MKETAQSAPKISIVIPCRNESGYIGPCLDSVLANDYPQDKLEILIADGGSTDGTRETIQSYITRHPNIKLIDNPGRTTPRAFNLGIKNATGELILILSAHSTYPRTYISATYELLAGSDAENAGGRFVNLPNGDGPWAMPIAVVTGHRFGVGNGAFRTSNGKPSYTDTVAFGLYRKKIFDEIGLFDERLTRNQDNELNDRLRRAGHKIIFDPSIEIYYKNKAKLSGLVHQGYFTGMWNVYTLKLFPYSFKWRRFVPAAFVSYLLSIPFVLVFAPRPEIYLFPAALYIFIDLAVSFTRPYGFMAKIRIAVTFFSYHLAYGLGALAGLSNVVTGRWEKHLGKPL